MTTRVYIGGLDSDVNDRDIEKFLEGCGRIREVILKKGFGFVEFDDHRDAEDAVYDFNGKKLLGRRVTVEFARPNPRSDSRRGGGGGGGGFGGGGGGGGGFGGGFGNNRRNNNANSRYGSSSSTRTKFRVIVTNLSSSVSWQDLKDFMRKGGDVTYGDAHKQHRNEGVVDFATKADMKKAIEKLNNTELNGRRVKLIEDKSQRSRSRSRSRSRNRSASRSRSRSRSARRSYSRSVSRSRSRSPRKSSKKEMEKLDEADLGAGRVSVSRSRSRSYSRSRSASRCRSKSRSKTPEMRTAGPPDEQFDDRAAEINE